MRSTPTCSRRLERGALVWCCPGGRGRAGNRPVKARYGLLGIAGGGVLAIVSFYAIRGSVDAAVRALAPAPGPGAPGDADVDRDPSAAEHAGAPGPRAAGIGSLIVKMSGRYALLALLAYVMIARLRLHPLGLLLGASSLAPRPPPKPFAALAGPARRHSAHAREGSRILHHASRILDRHGCEPPARRHGRVDRPRPRLHARPRPRHPGALS